MPETGGHDGAKQVVTMARNGWSRWAGCAPSGSGCVGSLRLYDDSACAVEADNVGVASFDEQCINVFPPGRALGSKAITDLAYLPGACLSTGGEPTGAASEDPADAVTFCCLAPFEFAE